MSHKKINHLLVRTLEILPGFVSWNLILFPYWGVFVVPNLVAYFILLFNIYWFYQSFQIAVTSTVSHIRMQASMRNDWVADLKREYEKEWQKVMNFIIIPTYKEPLYILERTLKSIEKQTLAQANITVVIAQEFRAPEEHRKEIEKGLIKTFGEKLNIIFTVHKLTPGEIIGKASNERYAAIETKKKMIGKGKADMDYATVTSCDADHTYHPNHFAALTYLFLNNPKRHLHFWQPAVMFYNNIWELPAITRIQNTLSSIWNMSQLPRRDRLINQQNYSLSFKLLDDAGYWDADKIPEDWGIFFKAFYKKQGRVEVEPIYLPLFADGVLSTSLIKTLRNQYSQFVRWAWGVSDTPWIIKHYILTPGVSFTNKSMRMLQMIQQHFLWPVNWFIVTIGLTLPTLLNPAFGRTTLGYMVPQISSFILTLALMFLIVMLIFDRIYKPARPKNFPVWRAMLMPLEFVLMPVAGFVFGALPGLDAHTRLMLGKYIEYKATEKV